MATAGYLWVEGIYLKYIDENNDEKSITGTPDGDGTHPGYIWIEGVNLRYIDANGTERYIT